MLKINKTSEPKSFAEHRCHGNSCYENIPESTKKELKFSLLKEQGYLCAYCMARISEENMKIEHIYSRNMHPELELNYTNLVACCLGNEGKSYKEQHCDTSKKDKCLYKNPAIHGDFIIKTISYNQNGSIKSSDKDFDNEINDTLQLNIEELCINRRTVYKAVNDQLSKLQDYTNKNKIIKILNIWKNKNKYGKFEPYSGVAIFILEKRLRKCK